MKFPIVFTCVTLAVLAGSAPLYANCGSPIAIQAAVPDPPVFASCGTDAIGQYWAHQNAVWNKVGPAGSGHDSGALSSNLLCVDCPSPGTTYRLVSNWGNAGADGCVITLPADHSRIGLCDTNGNTCTAGNFGSCQGGTNEG